jgi:DNA mismatch repair ATPase MutS
MAIIERAKENLDTLQTSNAEFRVQGAEWKKTPDSQLFDTPATNRDPRYEKIKSFLEGYDLNTVTPLQALQLLAKIKDDTD